VAFFGNSSEDSSGYYSWNFGDGTTGWGRNANHTFPSYGTYTVCLTYMKMRSDFPSDTCYAYSCDRITIERPACNISTNFTTIKDSLTNSVAFFGNSSEGTSGMYLWNFGDGTTGWGKNTTHTFSNSGSYTVCLTYMKKQPNSFDTCYAVFCDVLKIEGPECNISTSYTTTIEPNQKMVTFHANSTEDSFGVYSWNFGDGTIGWGQNASHTFKSNGTYAVCLTYMKTQPNFPFDTCYAFFCDSITIVRPTCNYNTSFSSRNDSLTNSVAFFGNTSNETNGFYTWSFDDGTFAVGKNATHIFSDSGTYVVCLTYVRMNHTFPFDTCRTIFCDTILVRPLFNHNQLEKIDPINISIYPIPASDVINFELSNQDPSEMTIEVLNHFGEVVKRSNNINGNFIDVYDLKEGFYVLRVKSETNIYQKGFLKN
jgi:PKD repeat protein